MSAAQEIVHQQMHLRLSNAWGRTWTLRPKGNALYSHLQKHGVKPESCTAFNLVVYGPLFPEEKDWCKHQKPRDKVAALEKELADILKRSHYCVMNTVHLQATTR